MRNCADTYDLQNTTPSEYGLRHLAKSFGMPANRICTVRTDSFVDSDDVLYWDRSLNIVDRAEYKSSTVPKDFQPFADLPPDLVGCSEWKSMLRIHTSTPKD